MPLIYYLCECKNSLSKFFRRPKDAPAYLTCPKCNKDSLKKSLSSPSSSSKISIDNGVQARSVEIVPNIVEINEQRSNKDYREE